MINVLLADTHRMFREGLKEIITKASDIIIKGEAENYDDILEKISDKGYDVVVLEIPIPDRNGIELIKEIKHLKPKLQILTLNMDSEDRYVLLALQAGASGYLTTDADSSELITAIRKVALKEKYISQKVAQKLVIALNDKAPTHMNLSKREFQVMCMIAKGKSITDIAAELSLSVNTISTFRSRILKKMKMKNNAEITYYALKEGLVN